MATRRIVTAAGRLDATLAAVPSKSVTHRALVAAALARGTSRIRGPLEADDTRVTRDGLSALGVRVEPSADAWSVDGFGGSVPGGGNLFLRDSGTSFRLLTAVAALGRKPSTLDGSARLRERPVHELADALRALGADVGLGESPGGLPLTVGGRPLAGGAARVPSARSSQFASALMLIAPRLPGGLRLELEPPVVSLPYVEITARVLRGFGADVERREELVWQVREGDLTARDYRVEGDHSSASYFLAAAAVVGGRVRVEGLDPASAQPDARLASVLETAGARVRRGDDWIEVEGTGGLQGFELDMGPAPDLVPTLAILALVADGPTTIHGIAHLRHKESDRLEVLRDNLERLGRPARADGDSLSVGPMAEGGLRGATVRTDSDHRMAMAFAVAGLVVDGVVIDDADCVAKSNPAFWDAFERLCGDRRP